MTATLSANEILLTQQNTQTMGNTRNHLGEWWSTLQNVSPEPIFGLLTQTYTSKQTDRQTHR